MAIAVVTGSSTGIGQATAATLARAGHTVYATMRNPKTGGEHLHAVAGREKLALHFAALDVDSDESVRTTFANILSEAGRIDVLVNNAGYRSPGRGRRDADQRISRRHGDQLLRCAPLYPGGCSRHARTTLRLHRQHHIRRGPILRCATGSLLLIEVCTRSSERMPCAGNESLRSPRCHRRARHHRNADLRQSIGASVKHRLPAQPPPQRAISGIA